MQTQLWKQACIAAVAATLALIPPLFVRADATPAMATQNFSGAITSRTADLLSVGTDIFSLSGNTVWKSAGNVVTDLSLFDVGDMVVVKATSTGSTKNAIEVDLMANTVPDSKTDSSTNPDPARFDGPLEAIDASGLSIEATPMVVAPDTEWTADGQPTTDLTKFQIGLPVLVTATFDGQTWTARSVELVMPKGDQTQQATDVITSAPIAVPTTQTFAGQITAMSDSTLDVGEASIQFNAQTQWLNADGTATDKSTIGVGDNVAVKALQGAATQPAASWVALSVTLVNHSSPLGGHDQPR